MALPTNLVAKIKAIPMDPSVLATTPELSYLLSFSANSIHSSIQILLISLPYYIPNLPINLHSNNISSLTSTTRLIKSFSRRPKITTATRTNKQSEALGPASNSSLPEQPPTPLTPQSSIFIERSPKPRKS
jgi:hypothetical protein